MKAVVSKAKSAEVPIVVADTKRYRVVLAEDHPIVPEGLAQWINRQPELSVVGEADTSAKALNLVRAHKPDLVILDVALSKTSGLELVKQIKAEAAELPVLIVSMHDEVLYAERALRAGARGYLMKKEPGEKVLLAIHCVLKGEIYVSERMKQKMLRQFVNNQAPSENGSPLDHLSDRELEVFQFLGNGFSTRQIAEHLILSVKTIESYRENLKLKLNLGTGAELVQYANQWTKSETARDLSSDLRPFLATAVSSPSGAKGRAPARRR